MVEVPEVHMLVVVMEEMLLQLHLTVMWKMDILEPVEVVVEQLEILVVILFQVVPAVPESL
jgi:hypothetical protein